jgi:hypothetical protein
MVSWTWQQACAWCIWRDYRMIELVRPKDSEEEDTYTVEYLLEVQKEARFHRRWYIHRSPKRSTPKLFGGMAANEFPEPVGSREAFERAVANGQIIKASSIRFMRTR